MRSGSTLLKALLATAPDVSELPEVNYQQFFHDRYSFYYRACRLSKGKIIVLKKPHWFSGLSKKRLFPKLKTIRLIVLYRPCVDVVKSMKKRMAEGDAYSKTDRECIEYWCNVYQNILESIRSVQQETMLVKYDELVKNPQAVTKDIFEFIGSSQNEGVDSYRRPKHYEWQWGIDDSGDAIKTLKVQQTTETARDRDPELEELIAEIPGVRKIEKAIETYPERHGRGVFA